MVLLGNVKNFIRRARRFGLRGPVTNLLGVYCSRFIPRKWMANLSEKRHEVIEAKICEIVDIKSCIPQPCEMKPCDTIWICWLMGEEHMPEVVKLCYRSVLKHSAGHPVVLLCEKNLKDYVDVPQVLVDAFKNGYISRTHFADKIRMSLLSQNGGFWMDATVFLTEDIPDYVFDLPLFLLTYCAIALHCLMIYRKSRINTLRLCSLVAGASIIGVMATMYSDNTISYSMVTLSYTWGFYGMALGMRTKERLSLKTSAQF